MFFFGPGLTANAFADTGGAGKGGAYFKGLLHHCFPLMRPY